MKWFYENYCKNENEIKTVLDIGSQCIAGQQNTYKIFFNEEHFKYIGVDMEEGNNVDIVLKKPYQWDEIADNFCDIIICGQVFEHIEFPWITINEIARVIKPTGIICIIVPSMQVLHRYPVNCQNYFCDGMIALAKFAGLEIIHASTNYAPMNAPYKWYDMGIQDTMVILKKPENWTKDKFTINNYICIPADLEKMANNFIPIEKQPWYKKWLLRELLKKIYYSVLCHKK
jgi:SAM-dependent methyltransferase